MTRKKTGGRRRTEAFTHTQGLLHREIFTQRIFLHTEGFTQRNRYSEELLHTEFLHTKVVTQRSLYSFNTKTRLHTETFTQRSLYTKSIYTQIFYPQRNLYTDAFSHREAFTQRSLYTEKLLHTETFTHKSFYTEKSLHRGAFKRSNKLKLAAVLYGKPFAGTFGNSLAPKKTVYFQKICSKKAKEYTSEAGPHSIAFKPALR